MVSGVIHDSRHDGKSWRPFHDPSIRNQLEEDLIRGLTHDRPGVDVRTDPATRSPLEVM